VNGAAAVSAQSVNEPLNGFAAGESTAADKSGFEFDATADAFDHPSVNGRQMRTTGDNAACFGDCDKRFAVNFVNVYHDLTLAVCCAELHVCVESNQIWRQPLESAYWFPGNSWNSLTDFQAYYEPFSR
jgi:hypothetical protein